jgi:glyoxylase-like metal-dependent hydrolase (beta-lactamase superfamily II)
MPIPGHTLGGVCAFLVRDRDGYVLIDSGMDIPSCVEALDAHLAALDVPLSALHTIVATHSHPDHLGQAARLRAASGARVWLHAQDAPLVNPERPVGDADLDALVPWLARYGFPPDEAEQARASVDTGQGATYLLEPDRLLDGGETFAVGPYRFEVVWTPGHTPGHVCLYESTRRLLLTGDHLFAKAAPNVRLMYYSPTDTMGRYVRSLERIAALPAERALPAHGEPFGQVAGRADEVIRHQLDRRGRLLGMMTTRPRTAYELAQVVWGPGARTTWDTFHGRLRRNAALTLAAHLEQLALDGEIARREDGGAVGFAERG